ncbi:Zn-ribbon domain-containing OB-fold protein [Kitasatospora sp. NPDC057223]|uniref:Zn-ribbon domain-containing OB-fold protein n=1 Tax=Kitasatospora sp. NPDC057223 TaxID=3346055 RepID=UPI00362E4464
MELLIAPVAAAPTAEPDAPGAELAYRRCRWCRAASAPTCLLCPVCGSADLAEQRSSGAGTVLRRLPAGPRGLYRLTPYAIALDEGFTVRAAVLGDLPGAVAAGTRVQLATGAGTGRLLTFRTSSDRFAGHSGGHSGGRAPAVVRPVHGGPGAWGA